MSSSVENEWLSAQILRVLGLPVAECEIATFGERKVLIVKRFDRVLQSPQGRAPWLARLPQEDFCQALGIPGERKYESDGGPGIRVILRQLESWRCKAECPMLLTRWWHWCCRCPTPWSAWLCCCRQVFKPIRAGMLAQAERFAAELP